MNGRAIHHLGPLEDVFIREWTAEGTLAGMTLAIGRFAKSAFAAKAADIPVLDEKLTYILDGLDVTPNSHAWREARAIFNHFPKRELFYARREDLCTIIEQMVTLVGDDEIAVAARQGTGYAAVTVAFSDVRYSPQAEAALRSGLQQAFGPILFSEWADLGTKAIIVFYFDAAELEAPIDVEKVRVLTRQSVTTWEDQVALELEQAYGTIEGRRLFNKYVQSESRSGLYRESTTPQEVPADLARLEALEGRLEMSVLPESAEQVTIKLFAPKPLGLTGTLRTLQNLGLPVVEELSLTLVLPDNRTGFLERLRIQAAPKVITRRGAGARSAARRAAGPAREARHRRCAERPGDERGPDVAAGGGAAHAAQPPDPGAPELQRRHDHRRDAAQQRRGGGAVPAVRCALQPGRRRRPRSRRRSGRSRPARRPAAGRQPARRRDPARRGEPAARRGAHQRLPDAGAAGGVDEGGVREGGRHGRRRGRCTRSTCTRRTSRASTCAAARWRAAACAGAIATTTSAPRSSA